MFVEGMTPNDPDEWTRMERSDRGLDPADQTPSRYDDGIGQRSEFDRHWWTALENYGNYGVAYDLLEPLAQWAEKAWPKGDWMGLIEPFKDNPPQGSANAPPSVSLTAPTDGTTFEATDTITLDASASDSDGSISSIEFFADGQSLGTDTTVPYSISTTALSGGYYTLTAAATDDGGATTTSGSVQISIENADGSLPAESGVTRAYFEGTWDAIPDFDSMSPVRRDTTANFTISSTPREDNFGYRLTAYVEVIEEGSYSFHVESDDGSKLYVNDNLLIDNDGIHAPEEKSGSLTLSQGYHQIVVDYFEASGGNTLNVEWTPPSSGQNPIPESRLVVAPPSTTVTQTVDLTKGWNLVSSHVEPTDSDMKTVFGSAADDIALTKDENGTLFSPDYGVTDLNAWSATEGYKIYATTDVSITLTGQALAADAPIPLREGWNIVSYLPTVEMPVEDAFSSLGNTLVVVENSLGESYIPNEKKEFSTVKPTQGYKVFVSQADTLQYPNK
jgi:hypothetical protein